MALEHAVLEVLPGQEAAFEEAFATAKTLISAAGFRAPDRSQVTVELASRRARGLPAASGSLREPPTKCVDRPTDPAEVPV